MRENVGVCLRSAVKRATERSEEGKRASARVVSVAQAWGSEAASETERSKGAVGEFARLCAEAPARAKPERSDRLAPQGRCRYRVSGSSGTRDTLKVGTNASALVHLCLRLL